MADCAATAPTHLAIIMDGNGRWARARGLPRALGHRAGVEALRRTVKAAVDCDIPYLTVFGFSTENWKRPKTEIAELFGLLREFVKTDVKRLKADGIRVRIIGSRRGLDDDIVALLRHAEDETKDGTRLNLNVAFNYGGQDDIVHAARTLAADVAKGALSADAITPDHITAALYTADMPPLDLLIRTSGEQRLSNFMLWQAAYAELVFQDTLWPDYGAPEFEAALQTFTARQRRFGAVEEISG
jgi:undecaprenyl diphosphate synthase